MFCEEKSVELTHCNQLCLNEMTTHRFWPSSEVLEAECFFRLSFLSSSTALFFIWKSAGIRFQNEIKCSCFAGFGSCSASKLSRRMCYRSSLQKGFAPLWSCAVCQKEFCGSNRDSQMTRIQFIKINHKQTVMHSLGEFLDLSPLPPQNIVPGCVSLYFVIREIYYHYSLEVKHFRIRDCFVNIK